MREIKDTLGIKLTHYSKIYNMDNAHLGLIFKYLLWNENQDYIIDNTPEYLRDKMRTKTKENTLELYDILDKDAIVQHVFTDMCQQVKISRECWLNLKKNLDKKKKDEPWYVLDKDQNCTILKMPDIEHPLGKKITKEEIIEFIESDPSDDWTPDDVECYYHFSDEEWNDYLEKRGNK